MPEPSLPETVSSAAAVIIGNELLSGKVREANLYELARTLRTQGVRLQRVVMVEDDLDVIAQEILQLSRAFDVVFTSGGVGPTHDDVTIEAVARAFGVSTCVDPTVAALLREHYGEICADDRRHMARVPEGAQMTTTSDLPWPTIVMRNVWVLPGVPEVFRMKLNVVRSAVRGEKPFFCRAVVTRLEEHNLKTLLDRVVAEHPEVEVGSYPKWFDPDYKTKVTFDGRERDAVEAALGAFLDGVPESQIVRTE